ncbi:2-hydroxyacid dehydrogenase [Herbiconiux solani]|uniref:2-hydroxyacid dehydrogenase n=1 Tax=Herbiconiux solani TaxID=661329 RepID=UPI0008255AB2|nr:D-glycerate dehydrogenase [Herbiconiux solani]
MAEPDHAPTRIHLTFDLPPKAAADLAASGHPTTSTADVDGSKEDRRQALVAAAPGASAIIATVSDLVDAEVMDAAGPGLRVIANYGVGYDNIDVAAAHDRGIVVTNTPGVLDEATADLAFALLLAGARRVVEADRFVRSGAEWSWEPDFFVGLDVSAGATLGIVGLGRIGFAVARRAAAFGMRIVATGSRASSSEAAALGVTPVELPELLATSDVVTLHCPLTPETHHLIGAPQFAAMKSSALLVNTSRGAVVDEDALLEALLEGTIGGAALDVYEHEPRVTAGLLALPNVITAPHIGSAGIATRERMGAVAVENALAVLGGATAPNPV